MPYDHTNSRPETGGLTPAAHERPEWAKSRREKRREAEGRRRARWPFAVVALIAAVGIGALQLQGANAPTANASTDSATTADALTIGGGAEATQPVLIHPVDTARIKRATLQDSLRVTGALRPRKQLLIKTKASGTVSEVNVRLGDRVATGQLLLQIDDEMLRNQVDQQAASLAAQKAQLATATAEADRAKQLARRGVSASITSENASSNLAVQQAHLAQQTAALAASEINMRDAALTAPFAGIVAKRLVEPGQTIAAGDEVFELVDLSKMTFESHVPVSNTLALSEGQEVRFTVEGLAGESFAGKIEGVSPTAASGSRNALISILVDNPNGKLRGGMFATGSIELRRKDDSIGVGADAMREDDQGKYVLKIAGGRVLRQPVETDGAWHGGKMLSISAGLQPGDQIVVGKLSGLEAGTGVRVTEVE